MATIAPRRAGSDAERRAARHLEQRLRALGREAAIEPTRIRPRFALTHLIHAVAGVVGSVLAVYAPAAGFAVAATATVSALGDLSGGFLLVRRLTGVRASQNVVSSEDSGKPGRLILAAHYDAPVAGALQRGRLRSWPAILGGSLALITLCCIPRLAGIDPTALTAVQFLPTVVLIAAWPLLADVAIAGTAGGRADNAAGVAVALRAAEELGGRLEHFDLTVVLTGGSAHDALGMRRWLARHRRALDPETTAVVAVDRVGDGDPAFAEREGALFRAAPHPALADICRAEAIPAVTTRELSDAYAARAAGLPALRLTSMNAPSAGDDQTDPGALARTCALVTRLLRRIDEEIGPQLA